MKAQTIGLSLALCFLGAAACVGAECEPLQSAFEKWVAAYANRNLIGTMSIFADDVNMCFQGAPDAKKANLEKSYRDEFAHPEQARR